jgi:hypothetical protein
LFSVIFGLAALLTIWTRIQIIIPGTHISTDPREIFVTVGTALVGPVGSVIVGLLASMITQLPSFLYVSISCHIIGSVWMGFAYKKLVHEKLPMPVLLLGWVGLVVVYYFFFLFGIGTLLVCLNPPLAAMIFLHEPSGLTAYLMWLRISVPEAILTVFVTTVVIAALPRKYRTPIWRYMPGRDAVTRGGRRRYNILAIRLTT